MADASTNQRAQVANHGSDRYYAMERAARLWSGVILFVFVATHLLNHAVGIFGVDAMEAIQPYRTWLWRTWVGTALLYGAALVHVASVSRRIVTRRTWRMPLQEAVQIALGLTIPLLLYEHVIGTRVVSSFAGVDDRYMATLVHLYPGKALTQIALITVVWTHGIIGLHYSLRSRSWFPKWREPLLVLAVLVPVLGIAGFVSGAREALEIGHPAANWNPNQQAVFLEAARWANWGLLLFAGALATTIVVLAIQRRLGKRVSVRYLGHGQVDLPKGSTLLEASREAGIPHPSICGGRGRCSTCRVLVTDGHLCLPDPGPAEAAMLKRISAPPRVRLACQIRPTVPISVQVLLQSEVGEGNVDWGEEAYKWGTEQTGTVLIVDMRAFTKLMRTQLPYDLVVLLNRYLSEMRQAVEAHNGRVAMLMSDGIMAVFGLNGERASGSRAAIAAAQDMMKAVNAMNDELQAALTMPMRIGIGIHTGPVVMARVGDEERGYAVTALGETVTVAGKLEEATKTSLTDCLVADVTLEAAGRRVSGIGMRREVHIKGLDTPIVAHALSLGTDALETA